MKKISLTLVLFLVVIFSLPASASAATNPGVKPGSFFYFFDTTFEQISLFFTFSPEKKVEKALAYADERLAEIEALAEEQNPNAVKTAISNYESNIALAAEKSKEVQDKGKAENLFTLIADNASKNREVLSAVLIKVPEEAKEAIVQAIEASRKGQEEATQQIAQLKSEIEQLKKEVADLKAENETQTKAVEELSRQKPKSTPAPAPAQVQPVTPTPQTSEITPKSQNETQINNLEKEAKVAQIKESIKQLGETIEKQRNVYSEWIDILVTNNNEVKSAFTKFKNKVESNKNVFSSYSNDLKVAGIGVELMQEYLIKIEKANSFSETITKILGEAKNEVIKATSFWDYQKYEELFKEVSSSIVDYAKSYDELVMRYNSTMSQIVSSLGGYDNISSINSYYQREPLKTCLFSIEGSIIKDYHSGSVKCYPF